MFPQLISFSLLFIVSSSLSAPKYVNPCGIVYSAGTLSHHSIKSVFHHMIPTITELLLMLKASHHQLIEDYKFHRTWIPDENNLIATKSTINIAKQLPDIYKSLMTFSYALDLILEDSSHNRNSDMCFFFIDTIPNIIDKHRELICTMDATMGTLGIDIPDIDIIDLPNDWSEPQTNSCVDKFFRFSETHKKYRQFLTILEQLLHV
ncbi:uncharacterized protein [Halyomorpha halys]|uniref:uncharacterized protein n=1 Tax=Halyomorpha halys TaxID=286706 RepID=UPI0006D50D14|nr:uncharacterized protein LOC106680838 [Halyomorpha halys]